MIRLRVSDFTTIAPVGDSGTVLALNTCYGTAAELSEHWPANSRTVTWPRFPWNCLSL